MTTDALPLPLSPTVKEAYAFCRRITHRYGANFSVGFRFLPAIKRRAVYAAYAWCRWADDIADEPSECGAKRAAFESGGRAAALQEWQAELEACYAGAPHHPITMALADALQHFPIPKSAFVALIDGCRQDMFKTRYETFDELLQYCALVAWSISDISLAIFGYRSAAAIDHGHALATALQLKSNFIVLAGQARGLLVSRDYGKTVAAWSTSLTTAVAKMIELPGGAVLAVGDAGATVLPRP